MKIKREWEIEFNAMKEICARNGIKLNQELYERAVRSFLRDHNWPPGNSQIQLTKFSVQTKITQKCEYPDCPEIAKYECYSRLKTAKPIVFYCEVHKEYALERGLLRGYKPLLL